MENAQIADILDHIGDLLELGQEDQFRIRSYRNAARTVRDLPERLEDYVAEGRKLDDLSGVGKSTAEKINEILKTGTCRRLIELEAKVPAEAALLMRLPGLGPRKAMELYTELGVRTLADLKAACEQRKVRELKGMGWATEAKLLAAVERAASAGPARVLYRDAAEQVESLGRFLGGIKTIRQWAAAGSFRRRCETVGDLDVLIEAGDRERAAEAILAYGPIAEVLNKGHEKVTIRLASGLQVDFRFFEADNFGSALAYFTGSKAHNIAMRRRAQAHKWKLNEYGLFSGSRQLAGATEEDIYRRLKLPMIPPELREDRGEIDAAEAGRLPRLIELADVRGDLQGHTTETDGTATAEEMARAARDKGYEYFAVTDHSKRVTMARGMNEDRLRRQAERIRKLNESFGPGFQLLAGVEVDILKTGALDLDEKVLAELDWVVASVHYDRNMDERRMTDRLLAAIRSGVVHTLGHPLGRIIGRREPLRFDVAKVVAACVEHNVRLEINGQPDRLDLPDNIVKEALEAGAGFTLGTDAHRPSELEFMQFAVNVARRGWLSAKNVLNACSLDELKRLTD